MRTSVLAFASLLLLLLAATTHGIRMDRQLHEAIHKKLEVGDSEAGQGQTASIADQSVKKHCTPDGHCSGKVKRAAAAHAESAAATQQNSTAVNGHTAVDDEATSSHAEATTSHGGSQEKEAAVATSRVARPRDTTYPDMMDLAGMDYSPAARKPPIHN
ncbi:hypothetical protein ACP4OV_025723 [Aristida adscensionis]